MGDLSESSGVKKGPKQVHAFKSSSNNRTKRKSTYGGCNLHKWKGLSTIWISKFISTLVESNRSGPLDLA